MDGRCQCGQIKFKTPLPKPLKLLICHCTECRHQSSSTYGMTALFPRFELNAAPGTVAVFTRPNSSGHTACHFCTNCGSRLIHEHVSPNGKVADLISVKSGCLDGITKEDMREAVHVWTKSAVIDIDPHAEQWEEECPGGTFSFGDQSTS